MDVGYNEDESVEDLFKEIWERESQAVLHFEVDGAGTVGCCAQFPFSQKSS